MDDVRQKGRLKRLANYAQGKVLDVAYNAEPNPYLQGADGLDLTPTKRPSNYSKFFKRDLNSPDWYKGLGKYDTILAGEVLEHVESPSLLIRGCYHLLNPNGRLVLSTPNAQGLKNILGNYRQKGMSGFIEHISLLPPVCIKRIFHNNGFIIIKEQTRGFAVPYFSNIKIPFPTCIADGLFYVVQRKE